MEYDENLKTLSVHGRVRSVFNSQKGTGSFFESSSTSSPGIVKSDEMRYWADSGRLLYTGNVHSLSENQELRADKLDISEKLEQVDAQGSIRHLISKQESPGSKPSNPSETSVDRLTAIQSSAMNYFKDKNKINYSGKVTLHSKDVDLSSDDLDAIPDSDGKKIEQATARGNVVVHYGARLCKGDIADYFMNSGRFIVTGKPAEVYDPEKGRSFARRLTSSTADDTILLEK